MRSFFVKRVQAEADYLRLKLVSVVPTYVGWGMAVLALVVMLSGLQPFAGVALLFAALLVRSYAPTRTVVLRRDTDELMVIKRQAVGLGPTEVKCALGDIQSVELVASPSASRALRVELVLADGSRLPIERAYSTAEGRQRALAAAIEEFLAGPGPGPEPAAPEPASASGPPGPPTPPPDS